MALDRSVATILLKIAIFPQFYSEIGPQKRDTICALFWSFMFSNPPFSNRKSLVSKVGTKYLSKIVATDLSRDIHKYIYIYNSYVYKCVCVCVCLLNASPSVLSCGAWKRLLMDVERTEEYR